MTRKIRLRLSRDFKTNLYKIPIWGQSFWTVWNFASFSQEYDFVFMDQILRRYFDLGFRHTSNHIHRKLQYREKAFEEFKRFFLFPRKMIL